MPRLSGDDKISGETKEVVSWICGHAPLARGFWESVLARYLREGDLRQCTLPERPPRTPRPLNKLRDSPQARHCLSLAQYGIVSTVNTQCGLPCPETLFKTPKRPPIYFATLDVLNSQNAICCSQAKNRFIDERHLVFRTGVVIASSSVVTFEPGVVLRVIA